MKKLHRPRWPFILRSTHERERERLNGLLDEWVKEFTVARDRAKELDRKLAEAELEVASGAVTIRDVTADRDVALTRVKELEEKLAAKAKPVKRGKRKK